MYPSTAALMPGQSARVLAVVYDPQTARQLAKS
jgi:hypothetical protein